MQRGFDYQYGAQLGEIDYFTHEVGGKTDWYRNNKLVNEKGYVTTLLGDDAVRFIAKQDPNKPFFMSLAFTAPHTPYQAPQKYLDKYKQISDAQKPFAREPGDLQRRPRQSWPGRCREGRRP